jgi:hypothetical protein
VCIIKYLANKLPVSIVAAGTYEPLHVMRSDPQIASRFEQHELPVWTESRELRRFIAGYLALLPLKKAAVEIDRPFVEYLLQMFGRRNGPHNRGSSAWCLSTPPIPGAVCGGLESSSDATWNTQIGHQLLNFWT